MREFIIALRSLSIFILLTGVGYPLLVTGLGKVANAEGVQGSLLRWESKWVGSRWLAQSFQKSEYFWSRPSAGDYATVSSVASNKGPTSKDLHDRVKERRLILLKAHHLPQGADIPPELLLASGSGLDPDLSPEAVRFQLKRVAHARNVSPQTLESLLQAHIEPPQFGFLGASRVNILQLNLALDLRFPLSKQGGSL